mgnify:CR=1 FL=1
MSVKSIALISKPYCPQSWGILHEIAARARRKGMVAYAPQEANFKTVMHLGDEAIRAADAVIAVGGDGTLLGAARSLFNWHVPLLGVNLGTLGFLTDVAASDIDSMLDALLAGAYQLEERIVLETWQKGLSRTSLAFNDAVIKSADGGQLAQYDVFVDGEAVFSLRADGLIVATPTGSTAYALSANGPILHPALAAVGLVPLNPHSLTARPITLPSACNIEVVSRGRVTSRLYCDGQPCGDLPDGESVLIRQAPLTVKMLHLNDYNIFNTLRKKLNWSSPRER